MVPGSYTVLTDERDVARIQELLGPKRANQALYQAVKRTTSKTAVAIKREVKKRTYLKKAYIDAAIKSFVKPGDVPEGVVRIVRQTVPLMAFKVRVAKRTGVTVDLGPGLKSRVFRHAFKATVTTRGNFLDPGHAGHTGLWLRTKRLPQKGPNVGKGKILPSGFVDRFTIQELFGVPVIQVVNTQEVLEAIRLDARAELMKQLRSQLARFGQGQASLPSESESESE